MNSIVFILAVTAVLVTLINLFCITIIAYTKRLHKAAHLGISSLLLAHLVQGILVIPSYAVKRSRISNSHHVCDIFRFTYFLTNYASCLSLVLISLDRCLSVIIPLKYKMWITQRRMLLWITSVWVYILFICLIPFFLSEPHHIKCKYYPEKVWTLVMLLGHTLVPFVIVFACYAIIFSKVKVVMRQRRIQTERVERHLARRRQWDKSKTTIVIVFFYVLCWGPSFVYYTMLMVCPKNVCFTQAYLKSDIEGQVTFAMKFLTFADGLIAPLLYCFSNKSFAIARKRFTKNVKLRLFPRDPYDGVAAVSLSRHSIVTEVSVTPQVLHRRNTQQRNNQHLRNNLGNNDYTSSNEKNTILLSPSIPSSANSTPQDRRRRTAIRRTINRKKSAAT